MARQPTRAGRQPDHQMTRIQGDGRATRIRRDGGSTRSERGERATATPRQGRATRIHGDGRGAHHQRARGSAPARAVGRVPPPARGGAGPARPDGRAAARLRGRLRLVSAAARRVAHAAAHAAAASVAGTAPSARPVPVRPTPAAGRRYAAQRGPGAPVLVVAALMALIVVMLGVDRVAGVSLLPDQLFAGLRTPPRKFPVLPASPPTEISIGRLGLRAPVHRVGLAADGSIAVPELAQAGEAGWYDQGPTPGQYGPAVIVGHVDTTTGPAVFHDLKKLDGGDRVEVAREDRSVAVFEVTSVRRYGKERLPVDEIYGDFSRPNLRLITCGGQWVGGETGYADNLVVYASLVRARDA